MRNRLIVALLLMAIVAGAAAGYLIGAPGQGSGTPHLYQVEFMQESNCPYGSWLVPWAVMIGHQIVAQPPNATLPLSYGAARLTGNSTYSTIRFTLPNGTYAFSVLPSNALGQQQSGNVTADGTDVIVQVYAFVTSMGCSSTTAGGG